MGGSGGGGSSGQVRYPAYVEGIHEDWLDATGTDTIDASVTEVMNDALGVSPYASAVAYDPDADITAYLAEVNDFENLVDLLSSGTGLNTLVSNILSDSRVQAEIDAYEAMLVATKTASTFPRFEAGMRDINSVMASAFVTGKALIEEEIARDVAKYAADLRMKAFSDDALRVIQMKLEFQKAVSHMVVEAYRIKIVAKKEEADLTVDYDVADGKWDLEVFQYGANVMAAPAGGTAIPSGKKGGAGSVLAGGISGASAGAMAGSAISPGIGTAIGAAAGGLMGLASGLL
jgi:hypothetical protein